MLRKDQTKREPMPPALPPRIAAEIERILNQYNAKAYNQHGRAVRGCSQKTRDERKKVICLIHRQIRAMGYKIHSPYSLKRKHVEALAKLWIERGLGATTIHTYFSVLKVWAGWINKSEVVGNISDRFAPEEIKRSSIIDADRSWKANGVDVAQVIDAALQLDERMALYLALQATFGLRRKESIELRPIRDCSIEQSIVRVATGTKGGRPRILPIETEAQLFVVKWACRVAKRTSTGRIRWAWLSWTQANNRFSYLAAKLGLTSAQLGVTAHGLRRQNLMDLYARITGLPTPVEGGAPWSIDRQTHARANQVVAEVAGHGRAAVAASYYGSFGHKLRGRKAPPVESDSRDPSFRIAAEVTPWVTVAKWSCLLGGVMTKVGV